MPTANSESQLLEEQWTAVMSEYEKSGLSQQEFCNQRSLNFKEFSNSRNRIAYRKKKASLADQTQKSFTEVKVRPAEIKFLKLIHPNGIECKIPMSLSDANLLQLLRGLRTC